MHDTLVATQPGLVPAGQRMLGIPGQVLPFNHVIRAKIHQSIIRVIKNKLIDLLNFLHILLRLHQGLLVQLTLGYISQCPNNPQRFSRNILFLDRQIQVIVILI